MSEVHNVEDWINLRRICYVILLLGAAALAVYAVIDGRRCMGYHYPMPMLGSMAENWKEALAADIAFVMCIAWVPILAVVILIVLSTVMIRRYKRREKDHEME